MKRMTGWGGGGVRGHSRVMSWRQPAAIFGLVGVIGGWEGLLQPPGHKKRVFLFTNE